MRKYIAIVLSLVFILTGCGETQIGPTWQEQYDLGVRYLSEGNYEEAIIAFTAAIEIEPKRPEAYIGLSDAYTGLGDTDAARQALEDGFAATGDADIQTLLEAMQDSWVERPDFTGQPGDGLSELLGTLDISMDEVCIDGVPIRQLTIEQVQQLRPEAEEPIFGIRSNSTEYTYGNWSWYNGEKLGTFDVEQRFDSPCITRVEYESWMWDGAEIVLDVGFRGLHTGDSLVKALTALGFTDEGASLLAEAAASRTPDDALMIVLDIPKRDAYLVTAGNCAIQIYMENGWSIGMSFIQGQRMENFTVWQTEE